MNDQSLKMHDDKSGTGAATTEEIKPNEKPDWETPEMEDVSDQVMAQPYIRFT